MRVSRKGWAVVAALGLGFSVPSSAVAEPETAAQAAGVSGAANAGLVQGKFTDGPVAIGPLARCTVAGQQSASTPGAGADHSAHWGPAQSTCTRNAQTGDTMTRTSGRNFVLDAYGWFGEDAVSIDSYAVRCTGTKNKVSVRIAINGYRLAGLSEDELPNPIPPNYKVYVNNTKPSFPPQAKIVFNEQVPNGRGGLTISVLHMDNAALPGMTKTQDVYLGRADCAPTR